MKQRAQEPDELPLRKILFAAFVTIVVFGVGIAGAAAGLGHRDATPVPPPRSTVRTTLIANGAPGLERTPSPPFDRFAWADRDAGIAIIPLDRAIDITLEERK